jgi:hypothetical protein
LVTRPYRTVRSGGERMITKFFKYYSGEIAQLVRAHDS